MYVYFNNFFPVTHKSGNINVYSSSGFINSTAVLSLTLLYAAGKVSKGLSSFGLLLAGLAAELMASWTSWACKLSVWNYLFQSSRIMRANVQSILFSFLSKWSHLTYYSFHDSWNFRVFLIWVAAGVVGVVLLSQSCFPPKKVFSELWACFVWTFQQVVFWKKI